MFEMGMFNIMSFIFPIFFIVFFAMFIFIIVSNIKEWSNNNKQPIIPVASTIISKRINVSHHHHGETHTTSRSTTYYTTFQFDNGERLELKVSGKEYGLMAEGDKGILSFQGTRFISFERENRY
ncbi:MULTISPECIES: DUF2500 domain-containing protein [Clostridium]|uniref:Protein of uncharacterized function (DUF2500) n=1 Tax=Clostridium disporicum TaxID=84024 RepID=A0A174B283_9CLOT|nr:MULTISPECIES: DUF2500 domain-containing protein [Clostridium]MCD2500671.1 DUF2500 domain-containing protein [Clostridium sp. NSJ-145]CUN93856.1 Protein of uncharacterised function (DUF2500) [Clostridium disporicum]